MIRLISDLIKSKKSTDSVRNSSSEEENSSAVKMTDAEKLDPNNNKSHTEDNDVITFSGKIIEASNVDNSKFNDMFKIRGIDDEEHLTFLNNLKWNLISGDRVKCNGKMIDHKMDIIEIMPKIKSEFQFGRVTAVELKYAAFEKNIVCLFEAIEKYPLLKMHDEYKFTVIESDQRIDARTFENRVIELNEKVKNSNIGNGVTFESVPFKIDAKETKPMTKFITVYNKSDKELTLMSVKAIARNQNEADIIHLDKVNTIINYKLNAKCGKFKIFFRVCPKKIGKFNFNLICQFDDFEESYNFSIEIARSIIVPSRPDRQGPRFIDVQIRDYSVPNEMREIDFNKLKSATDDLLKQRPYLCDDLSRENYLNKMRDGIYLEEIAIEKAFAAYRIEKGVFENAKDCLRLMVKDVAEKRPSIIIGDRVTAIDPSQSDTDIHRDNFQGFIKKVEKDSILVKFHEDFHKIHKENEYIVDFTYSRAIFKKQQHALEQITRGGGLGYDFVFPDVKIATKTVQIDAKLSDDGELSVNNIQKKWFNNQLNKYQKNAVVNVMRGEMRPLPYVYFGCPGSGKSVTVVETILQIFTHQKSANIIVACPSNSAANLITEMLIESEIFDEKAPQFLRIVGNNQVERDLIPDMLLKYCATVDIGSENNRYQKTPIVNKNSRGLMINCKKSKIMQYRIIIGTLNSFGSLCQMSLKSHFSHVFIDEAGQSIEPETLIPMTLMKRDGQCVLAGDPLQLGPILVSRLGKLFKFNSSMLERLLATHPYYAKTFGADKNEYDAKFVTKLKINYRSHPTVLKLYNDLYYDGDMESGVEETDSIESLFLASNDDVIWKNANKKCGVFFVNVRNGVNRRLNESCSWYNQEEINGVTSFLSKCSTNKIEFKRIGVVTPYSLQVKKLKEKIAAEFNDTDLKIGTVEEFQGQEKMLIVVSTVRTNDKHLEKDARFGLGFVHCPKRMNVAISRARALLVVFGKETVLERDSGWKHLIEYTKNNNTYISEDY